IERTSGREHAHLDEVQIDTKKNEPLSLEKKQIDWESPRGTQVTMEVEGRYQKGRASVDEYVEQTIIANPHVKLTYLTPEGETKELPRTYDRVPESPREIKPHPYGIELGMLLKMLQDTKSHWLSGFLAGDFSRVSPRLAEDICKTAGLSPRARPRDVHGQAAENLYKAIQSTTTRSRASSATRTASRCSTSSPPARSSSRCSTRRGEPTACRSLGGRCRPGPW